MSPNNRFMFQNKWFHKVGIRHNAAFERLKLKWMCTAFCKSLLPLVEVQSTSISQVVRSINVSSEEVHICIWDVWSTIMVEIPVVSSTILRLGIVIQNHFKSDSKFWSTKSILIFINSKEVSIHGGFCLVVT